MQQLVIMQCGFNVAITVPAPVRVVSLATLTIAPQTPMWSLLRIFTVN